MSFPALQLNTNDPAFWVLVVVAVSFALIALAAVVVAVFVLLLASRDKIERISQSIDQTHGQLMVTTNYVTSRIINPAREIAAIMAGVRRGLEVLLAPAPKQINESYAEEEMFIG